MAIIISLTLQETEVFLHGSATVLNPVEIVVRGHCTSVKSILAPRSCDRYMHLLLTSYTPSAFFNLAAHTASDQLEQGLDVRKRRCSSVTI